MSRRPVSLVLTLLALLVCAAAARADDYPRRLGAERPAGFAAIEAYGQVVRVRDLPLRVFNSDPRFEGVFLTAVGHWNAAARSCGIAAPFEPVTTPDEADFAVDWSGAGLPSRALAATHTSIGMISAHVRGIVMRGNAGLPPGNMCEVLLQEFGHVLGLSHSQDPRDIMYERAHRGGRDLRQVTLSPRDVQMMSWLYAQENCIPLLRRTSSVLRR